MVIIAYKYGIYELPNNLRLSLNPIEWEPSAQFPCQNENFVNTSRKLLKNKLKLFPLCAIRHES